MTDRVILITGASSGIGWAAALAFARSGYRVCGFARRAERLEALRIEVEALESPHGDLLPVAGDVRNPQDVAAAVERVMEHLGRLDILVANAGVGHQGAVADAEWDDLQTVLQTNIDGVMHSVRAAVPVMRAGGGGHIMIITSVVSGVHTPYTATYSASKAFVSSLAGSLRLELADDNIAVTDVLVGRTVTEFNQSRLGSRHANRGGLPTKTADDVAAALVKAAERKPRHLILSLFDRLILAGGVMLPGVMARLARRQYEPRNGD